MPTYDYVCEACQHEFEEFQSMMDDPLKVCPECGKKKLRRLFGSGAAILFKGSGFYQTDYRSESYKAAAKADSNGTGSNGTAGKSDAKTGASESKSGEKSPKSSG
jgi:putative FmdB family regulatory protein